MAGISSKAARKLENRYRFNGGTELNTDLDVNWYETEFRSYDAQIGRFHQIDELADFNYDYSVYAFANDNPILMNDPFGLIAVVPVPEETSTAEKPKLLDEVVVRSTTHKKAESTASKVVDIATDFIPFVGGSKDIYRGIRDGNAWQVGIGVGSLALDFFTVGSASILKGSVKTLIREGAEEFAKKEATNLTLGIVEKKASNFILNEAINVTEDRFIHVIQGHYPRSGMYLDKSKFSLSAREIVDMIKNSAQIPKTLQRNGRFERIVDAGRNIGIDATTGQPTSIFTIITNKAGDLITSFPGRPN